MYMITTSKFKKADLQSKKIFKYLSWLSKSRNLIAGKSNIHKLTTIFSSKMIAS